MEKNQTDATNMTIYLSGRRSEETFEKFIVGKSGTNLKKNYYDFASSHASHLREHLKVHSGEKANKCNQCDYASSRADKLRQHLITHSGEKSNKCNQCDNASYMAGQLSKHLKKKKHWRKAK